MRLSAPKAALFVIAAVFSGLFAGCEDQPTGYIFTPTQRNISAVARTAVEVVNALYEHADPAGEYLEKAALTDDYLSLLPGGWTRMMFPDSLTGEIYPLYLYSYLNQKYYFLRYDRQPSPNAVRQPSSIDFTYTSVSSFQNILDNSFFGSVNELRRLIAEYAAGRTDTRFMDGWFENQRVVTLQEQITTATGAEVTYDIYVPATWMLRVLGYSIDPKDYSSRLVLDGKMPIYDEAGALQECHLSGQFIINSNGSGSGTINFYGRPAAHIVFTHRTYGFKGYYTLASDDFKQRTQF